MYNSDYIPLIEGDKRLTLNKLIACYRYNTSGLHDESNSAKIIVYGISNDIEIEIGTYYLSTSSYYNGNDFVSTVSYDFICLAEYDYLRLQIIDDTDDFLGIESEIHGIVTVSELVLKNDIYVTDIAIVLNIISPIENEVVGNWVE